VINQLGCTMQPPVAVCVPVRNEAAEISGLLDGLAAQAGCDLAAVTLCIFLDGCSDESGAILRRRAPSLPFPVMVRAGAPHQDANAGRARRAAMAVGRAALGARHGLLLTTDADTVPANDWIARNVEALSGADVVTGRIMRGTAQPSLLQDRIESYYERLVSLRRRLDPVPWDSVDPHHFTGGANMGFRVHAYDAVGGFAELRSGEDARIVDDAARLGLRVRRDRTSLVHTSSRREGRAAGGLAAHLHALDHSPSASASVAHPADMAWQYAMHARSRLSFERRQFEPIAQLLALPLDHVIGVARDCTNGEAFAMRMVPAPLHGMREITLEEAEASLAALETECMGQAA
jgi:hypothetical protein